MPIDPGVWARNLAVGDRLDALPCDTHRQARALLRFAYRAVCYDKARLRSLVAARPAFGSIVLQVRQAYRLRDRRPWRDLTTAEERQVGRLLREADKDEDCPLSGEMAFAAAVRELGTAGYEYDGVVGGASVGWGGVGMVCLGTATLLRMAGPGGCSLQDVEVQERLLQEMFGAPPTSAE